jgi:hypothetical protein
MKFPVREAEVNTFVSTLESKGARTTAIQNHYLQEQPRIVFVCAEGLGDPVQLAQAVQAAWSAIGAPVDADGDRDADDAVSGLDAKELSSIIQGASNLLEGTVKVTVGRNETIVDTLTDQGLMLPPEMGAHSEFQFQTLNGGQAIVVGEFYLRPDEVSPVLQVLRNAGFTVAALHNSVLLDDPHLFSLHIAAAGYALDLATAIRNALDLTNSQRL